MVDWEGLVYAGPKGWVEPGDLTSTSLKGIEFVQALEARVLTHLLKLVRARRPAVVVFACLLALPAQALADEASQDPYGGPGSAQQQAVLDKTGESVAPQPASRGQAPGVEPAAEAPSSSSSSLPFTRLDIALLLGAGGLFISVGLMMRRLSNPSSFALGRG